MYWHLNGQIDIHIYAHLDAQGCLAKSIIKRKDAPPIVNVKSNLQNDRVDKHFGTVWGCNTHEQRDSFIFRQTIPQTIPQ